jgi:signal peptidase II
MTFSRERRRTVVCAAVIAAIVALDRASKVAVERHLAARGSVKVFWLLYLTYVKNTGAAFSMLRGMNLFFIAVSIVLLLGMFKYRRELCCGGLLAEAGMLFVAGGAIGNLWDRLAYGAVTDFIDFRAFPAVFNVADSFITTGGIMLGLALYLSDTKEGA